MEIRKANLKDYRVLSYKLRNKHLSYNTCKMLKEDIELNRLYVCLENDNIIASIAVVPMIEHGYLGLKRLVVYSKKNRGKGIARHLIEEVTKERGVYSITPWKDNSSMIYLIQFTGFKYAYTFNEKWLCYIKRVE